MLNYIRNIFSPTAVKEKRTTNDVNVIWIHGANQTSLSFKYLQMQTKFDNEILINYSSMTRFQDNIEMIVDKVAGKGPHFVIGHSMGG